MQSSHLLYPDQTEPIEAAATEAQDQNWPKSWHDALSRAWPGLPWRTGPDGVRVLGDDFPRVSQAAELEAPAAALTVLDVAGLATPAVEPQNEAQQLGELVHAALQGLQPVAPPAQLAQINAQVTRVRAAFGWVFGPGSRAEVAVALPGGRVGRIDRWVPRGGEVWVIDFKTGAAHPEVPQAYRSQLQRYAQALRAGGEVRPLRAAVLWVDEARLAEVALAETGESD